MKIKLIIVLALAVLLLGCTTTKDDSSILSDFNKLKTEYAVSNGYNTDPGQMAAYINDLSLLRAEGSFSSARLLDAEIESSKGFYYLIKANDYFYEINYETFGCNSSKVKSSREYLEAKSFAKLSYSHLQAAVDLVASLSAGELANLRKQQLEIVKEYSSFAQELVSYLENDC